MAKKHDGEGEAEIIPLVEEEARIGKRQVTTGRVRIDTKIEEVAEVARATLEGETVEVERVPIDREITEIPSVRTDGDLTIVPVVEEVLVVEKRLVLKEELHIRRRRTSEEVEAPVTLRKERVIVERIPVDEALPRDKPAKR